MLVLEDVRKSYSTGPLVTEVLHGVQLRVAAGDLLSVMGASGSGKSTLMNIIGLLDQPTTGSYRLNGQETTELGDERLSSIRNASIGFVFQSFRLLPRLSAWENVGTPLLYRGMDETEIKNLATEALGKVQLDHRLDHKPSELSGGQQQRVAIARALVGRPALILADEPTGALDADSAEEIMRLLIDLNANERMTTVIITHDRKVAKQCARCTYLRDGLLQEGSRSESLP